MPILSASPFDCKHVFVFRSFDIKEIKFGKNGVGGAADSEEQLNEVCLYIYITSGYEQIIRNAMAFASLHQIISSRSFVRRKISGSNVCDCDAHPTFLVCFG